MADATTLVNARLPHAAAVTADELPRLQVPAPRPMLVGVNAFPADGT